MSSDDGEANESDQEDEQQPGLGGRLSPGAVEALACLSQESFNLRVAQEQTPEPDSEMEEIHLPPSRIERTPSLSSLMSETQLKELVRSINGSGISLKPEEGLDTSDVQSKEEESDDQDQMQSLKQTDQLDQGSDLLDASQSSASQYEHRRASKTVRSVQEAMATETMV